MNASVWIVVAAVANLIASIGVIAAVVLLARHIRDNSEAVRMNVRQSAISLHGNFTDLIIQNPDLQDIYRRGRKNYWNLKEQDLYRFSNLDFYGQATTLYSVPDNQLAGADMKMHTLATIFDITTNVVTKIEYTIFDQGTRNDVDANEFLIHLGVSF